MKRPDSKSRHNIMLTKEQVKLLKMFQNINQQHGHSLSLSEIIGKAIEHLCSAVPELPSASEIKATALPYEIGHQDIPTFPLFQLDLEYAAKKNPDFRRFVRMPQEKRKAVLMKELLKFAALDTKTARAIPHYMGCVELYIRLLVNPESSAALKGLSMGRNAHPLELREALRPYCVNRAFMHSYIDCGYGEHYEKVFEWVLCHIWHCSMDGTTFDPYKAGYEIPPVPEK